jgi:hypothetical protein
MRAAAVAHVLDSLRDRRAAPIAALVSTKLTHDVISGAPLSQIE